MTGIELKLSGNPAGDKILKALASPDFFTKYHDLWGDAGKHIATSNERSEITGTVGPEILRKAVTLPAQVMTAGDEAARSIMQAAGLSEEMARKATLTSEPVSGSGAAVGNARKSKGRLNDKKSFALQMLLPFYRTNVNQIEQGAMRVPVLGSYLRRRWKETPIPLRQEVMQQVVMTPATMAMGYMLGSVTPKKDQNIAIKFVSNFSGQYGTLASMGFLMGVAKQNGDPVGDQVMSSFRGILRRDSPLPTLDLPIDILDILDKVQQRKWDEIQLPYGVVPPVFSSKEQISIPSLMRDPEGFFSPEGFGRNKVQVTEKEHSFAAPFTNPKLKKVTKEKSPFQQRLEKQREKMREQRKRMLGKE
jgi:hypothetical protein